MRRPCAEREGTHGSHQNDSSKRAGQQAELGPPGCKEAVMAVIWRETKKHRHRLTLRARLGRQDKRPAIRPCYVVGVVDEFANPSTYPAGAWLNFSNDFNVPSAIAMPNPMGAEQ